MVGLSQQVFGKDKCNDEEEKAALGVLLQVDRGIYTVSKLKGLENEYIIVVNFLKAYAKEWQHFLTMIKGHKVGEERSVHRHLFNNLYVALTRVTKYVCLIDEFEPELIDLLFENKKLLNKFYEESFNLSKKSTQEERYCSAYKLEEAEHYKAAMKYYKKLILLGAKKLFIVIKSHIIRRSI